MPKTINAQIYTNRQELVSISVRFKASQIGISEALGEIETVLDATARFENLRIGYSQLEAANFQLAAFTQAAKEQHADFNKLIIVIGGIDNPKKWPK